MNLLGDLVDEIKGIPSKLSKALHDNVSEIPRMFGKYLGPGKEDTYDYSVPRLRNTKTVKDGEVKNQGRLLDTLATTKKLRRRKPNNQAYDSGLYSLQEMMDGDVFELDDHYDVDSSADDVLNNNDYDLMGSLGSFKLNSKSKLHFVKFGEKLLPYGNVEHNVKNETYDFNPGINPFYDYLHGLEKEGKASSYPVKASWKMQPMGVIKIKNGKIDRSEVEWEYLK